MIDKRSPNKRLLQDQNKPEFKHPKSKSNQLENRNTHLTQSPNKLGNDEYSTDNQLIQA